MSTSSEFRYDVCLSFAGEERAYVEQVAEALQRAGVKVFYDRHERVDVWGKDLYQHFTEIYQKHARYCVIFISAAYAAKLWTRHELRSAQARAFEENREYILPVRFDDTEIPGVLPTVGYLDISATAPEELSALIQEKLSGQRVAAPNLGSPRAPIDRATPVLATPAVLRDQPKVAAIRSRLTEPIDACDAYRDAVEDLVQAGRWAFNIGVAYPPELLAADERFTDKIRSFARELRAAVDEIDAQNRKRREELGILGLAGSGLDGIRLALIEAASATESLKDLRQVMRKTADRTKIREAELFQRAVAALNKIVAEIETAEEKRELDLSFFQLFVERAKQ